MEISGETVYLFRHGMLRDAAYQLQTPSFRATLHAWALELLEVLIPESERAPYAHELAEHALAAQEERADEAMQHKELAYLKLAANHARDSFQNNMAVEMFRRVAKHPQCAPGDRVEASVASARVLAMVGDVRGADAELAEVERDELSGELAALVGLARAELDSISGHLDTSIEALERAIMSAQAPRLRFDILRAKAAYLERLGRYDVAREVVETTERTAQELNDPARLGGVLSQRAILAMRMHEFDEAYALFRKAIDLANESGDRRALASATGNYGHILRRRNDENGALEAYREATSLWRQFGDLRGQMIGLGNMGLALARLERLQEALRYHEQAEAIAREVGDPSGIAMNVGNRGTALHRMGRSREALDCFRQAEQINRKMGVRMGLAINLANQAMVGMNVGDFNRAHETVDEAIDLLEALASKSDDLVLLYWVRSRVQVHFGRNDEAAESARAGLEVAKKIGLPDQPEDKEVADALRELREISSRGTS